MRSISTLLVVVVIVAATVAIVVAFIGYIYGIMASVESNYNNLACRIVPLKSVIYVENSCGIGWLELYIPASQQCSKIIIDSIEIHYMRAKPIPTIRNANVLQAGKLYYILVYYDSFTKKYYFYPLDSQSRALFFLKVLFKKNYCINGIMVGENYPGAIIWPPRTTYITWVTMSR